MPYYDYEAINPERFTALKGLRLAPGRAENFVKDFANSAQILSGTVQARTPEDAVAKLNAQGLVPVWLALAQANDRASKIVRLKEKLAQAMPKPTPPVILQKPSRLNWISIVGPLIMGALLALALYYASKQ